MAEGLEEAGYPSSSDAGPSQPSPSSLSKSRQLSRTHFVLEERSPLAASKFSPVRHSSPLAPQSRVYVHNKVHSAGDANSLLPPGPGGSTRSKRAPLTSIVATMSAPAPQETDEDLVTGLVSDEYDLAHEDPRILQDVQKALKLKARREARIKSGQHPVSPGRSEFLPSNLRAGPSTSLQPFPRQIQSTYLHGTTEIDFSPSTEGENESVKVLLHPVPSSSDNGKTLDWSGPGLPAEEQGKDRRWTLSLSKHKGKDRVPLVSRTAVEKQEKAYEAKIARLRTIANSHTEHKRSITARQLEKRYAFLSRSTSSGSQLTLTGAARWYCSQGHVARASLEKKEPFTWLKHLEKKTARHTERSPWHLSALILDEYAISLALQEPVQPIPQPPDSPCISSPSVHYTPSTTSPSGPYRGHRSPGFSMASPSRSSSFSLGPPLSRNKSLDGGRVSFEPLLESPRISFEGDSRKSGESGYSSILSGSYPHLPVPASPASSRLHVKDFGLSRPNRRNQYESDGSSARASLSGRSEDNVRGNSFVITAPPVHNDAEAERPPKKEEQIISSPPFIKIEVSPSPGIDLSENSDQVPSTLVAPPQRQDRRLKQTSLPDDRLSTILEQQRQQEAEDIRIDQEYKEKSHLLEEITIQNSRMRILLSRVAGSVRQYDILHSNLANFLNFPYAKLPQELLDALSHDPAVITSRTRCLQGYHAVDYIHGRLLRQHDIFNDFFKQETKHGVLSVKEDVLTSPINVLLGKLDELDVLQKEFSLRARSVADAVDPVRKLYVSLHAEHKATQAQVGNLYPEISQITALEESYKDQYQHLWELGMDALTFILDTVTPFWRTYGKTIGDDVQDFLIIPLYRNEFTGGTKRYPLTHFPKRSFRHWIALFLFFFGMVTLGSLQIRAAITSSVHYRLHWIPFEGVRWLLLPFFWLGILIQWGAVIVELLIVLIQIGVVIWWAGWWVGLYN